ncbi:MAG: cadmium-translocating P-type ATPase [Ruminococcaceae bacterium]|nr:cadmium-translocating P-type ATPase [Oscillospiraceae bacterium]
MTHSQKIKLARILIGAALLLAVIMIPAEGLLKCALFLIPYLVVGYDTLWKALRGCLRGQFFDEDFLMAVASLGALIIGEYPEAVAVMLFNQIGVLFESYAVGKSRKSIAALMDICPDRANLEKDGEITEVSPDEVAVGDYIVVKAGEKIPLDGIVEEGSTTVDTAALTGESMPRTVRAGDEVISGTVNLTGMIRVRVTKIFEDSTVSKILELVENASSKKAKAENFISKFSRFYTPSVVSAAILLAVIPSLFDGAWSTWIYRALTFLVISCPCALVISVPLTFFGGIGGASKCGILIKGGNYIEALSRCETVVFDKTGTLTKGTFTITAVHAEAHADKNTVLHYAAIAENNSNHPIAKSICEYCKEEVSHTSLSEVTELSGKGICVRTEAGEEILVGNEKLMLEKNVSYRAVSEIGTVVYVAVNGKFFGSLVISDEIKSTAKDAVHNLRRIGIRKTVMLTGDSKKTGTAVANTLGIDEVYTELLPADKVSHAETLLKQKNPKKTLAFVGDGINDAPVLSRADIGISMGAIGSDAAIEASDIVLMDDDPKKIALAIRIAKRTLSIAYQNIFFALGVKGVVLLLGAFGIVGMWAAVFADVGVSVIAILNAMRVLNIKKYA